MYAFAPKPKTTRPSASARSAVSDQAGLMRPSVLHPILHLRHTIGNQAVQRLLEAHARPAFNSADDFSQIPVHPPAAGAVRPKPAINKPGDGYEREADHVSEQVMRMPESQHRRACTCGGNCPDCQCSHDHEQLPMKQHSATAGGKVTASQIAHDLPNTLGQPLDAATLAFMEPRFGHDFSQVRVHTDAQAADSAKAIRARAYTVGRDVFFADGQFSPGSAERSKLLAHELSHVVQQCNGAPAVQRAPERRRR